MTKKVASKTVAVDTSNVRKGKYVGNCPRCLLILMVQDTHKLMACCPRCGMEREVATLKKGNVRNQ